MIFWAALPLLAACTNDAVDRQAQDGLIPVTLTAETVSATETRASAAAAQNLNEGTLTAADVVYVGIRNYATEGDPDYTSYSFTVAANGSDMAPTPSTATPYYPTDNDGRIDIIAYYPSEAATTFSVDNDQTTDAKYRASDLMWVKKANQGRQTSAVSLAFQHLMAKLEVNATSGAGVSYIKSITMTNVRLQSTFAPKAGTATVTETASGSISLFTGGEAANTTAQAACVFPGQEIAAGNLLEITVVKDGGGEATALYALDAAKTFTAGNKYVMNITVNRTALGTTNSISGWSADGTTVIIQPAAVQQTFDVDNNAILTFNVAGVQFQMIGVKGGNYSMTWSSTAVSGTLSSYYIGQTEVTNALWNAVMGSKPTGQKSDEDNYPVACVSWEDISTASTGFLAKLNDALSEQLPTGKTFKLPSEAQWQYAAIGGSRSNGYTYAGSNYLEKVAWWGNNGTTTHSYNNPSSQSVNGNSNATTHPVGLLMPNELGLFDMTGNVWEWCQDWYDATITASQGTDYVNTTEGSNRVNRGGSWSNAAAYCAVSNRHSYAPTNRNNRIGLRLVLQ